MAGDFRFSYLLIKCRKVSGSDDTRNQVARKGSWVRIPSSPPLGNNTNPDDKLEFVLFFSNEYFGIKVDLNSKKKKLPGVSSLGFFYAQITPRARLAVEFGSFLRHRRTILSFSLTFAIAIERKRLNTHFAIETRITFNVVFATDNEIRIAVTNRGTLYIAECFHHIITTHLPPQCSAGRKKTCRCLHLPRRYGIL